MIENYDHLKVIQMNVRDTKPESPTHVILEVSDYVEIKMQKCPRVGKINEPITNQNKMGWVIMSPTRKSNLISSLSVSEFGRLCNIDIEEEKENQLKEHSHV